MIRLPLQPLEIACHMQEYVSSCLGFLATEQQKKLGTFTQPEYRQGHCAIVCQLQRPAPHCKAERGQIRSQEGPGAARGCMCHSVQQTDLPMAALQQPVCTWGTLRVQPAPRSGAGLGQSALCFADVRCCGSHHRLLPQGRLTPVGSGKGHHDTSLVTTDGSGSADTKQGLLSQETYLATPLSPALCHAPEVVC